MSTPIELRDVASPNADLKEVATQQPKNLLVRRVEQVGLLTLSVLSGLAAVGFGALGLTIGFGGAPFVGPGAFVPGMLLLKFSAVAAVFSVTSFAALMGAVQIEQNIRDERSIAPFEMSRESILPK